MREPPGVGNTTTRRRPSWLINDYCRTAVLVGKPLSTLGEVGEKSLGGVASARVYGAVKTVERVLAGAQTKKQ